MRKDLKNTKKIIAKIGPTRKLVDHIPFTFPSYLNYPQTFTLICASTKSGQEGEGNFKIELFTNKDEYENYVEEYKIEESDVDLQFENLICYFIFFITGLKTLTQNKIIIKFIEIPGKYVYESHTCFNRLDIFDLEKDIIKKKLFRTLYQSYKQPDFSSM